MERMQINPQVEAIIEEVLRKQDRIIPIIGDSCFMGILESEDSPAIQRRVPLQEYIIVSALKGVALSKDEMNEMTTTGYYGMGLCCDTYCMFHRIKPPKFRKFVKSIVEAGIAGGKIFLKPDVKELLRVGKFDVIVTTNVFDILRRELATMHLDYNVKFFVPVASKGESRSEEKLSIPSIYHIFGSCTGEFVLTEDDLLKFLHYLNYPGFENGYGANSLVKYIKEKSTSDDGNGNCVLMPVGCDNLPNWLFRFLWYPLSPDSLFGKNDDYEGGVWYKYSPDKDFYRFLCEYNFQTLSEPLDSDEGETDPVLRELCRRLGEKTSRLQESAEKMGIEWDEGKWDIFISYAGEDKDVALKIYESLKSHGKKVWMDKRQISVGDKYWETIQYGIEHSRRCVFIVTDAYLKKAVTRTVRNNGIEVPSGVYEEIKRIEQYFLSQRKDAGFINSYSVPLIQDGTLVDIEDDENQIRKVPLDGGLLEHLFRYKKYQMLRTEVLFEGTQAAVLTENNFDEIMTKI